MKSAPGTWTTLHVVAFDSLTAVFLESPTVTPSTLNT